MCGSWFWGGKDKRLVLAFGSEEVGEEGEDEDEDEADDQAGAVGRRGLLVSACFVSRGKREMGRRMGRGVPVCHAGGGDEVAREMRVVFVRSGAWAMGRRSGVAARR